MVRPESQFDYYRFPPGGVIISQCAMCVHKDEDTATCEAFPDGIPDKILTNKVLHDKPIKGDNGIQFEPEYEGAKPILNKDEEDA
jgi:hypothetical protein